MLTRWRSGGWGAGARITSRGWSSLPTNRLPRLNHATGAVMELAPANAVPSPARAAVRRHARLCAVFVSLCRLIGPTWTTGDRKKRRETEKRFSS